jgi:hypothetical protein
LNGGIVGAIIALSSVYVLVAAYCMFNERFNKTKLFAIAFLIASVIII